MKKVTFSILSVFLVLALAACGGDSAAVKKTTYALAEVGDSGVSGTITFEKVSDTETKIDIALTGTPEDGSHPAHIHEGDADPGGGIYVTLGTVDGATGKSSVTVSKTDGEDGEDVSYEDLIAYDGYVNIHSSATDLATIVAQGETGAGATAEED